MDHAQLVDWVTLGPREHQQNVTGAELEVTAARKNHQHLITNDPAQPAHEWLEEYGELVGILDPPLDIVRALWQVRGLLYSCSFSSTHDLPSQLSGVAEGPRIRLTSPQIF